MISARPVTAASGRPPPSDFAVTIKIGLDAVALAGEQRAGAPEAGLHFVGDEEDAVLVAEIDQHLEIVRRRRDESAFAENRLGDHGGDFFVRDHALEGVFEMARAVEIAGRILQRIRAAIAIRERNAIDLAGKRRESGLVRMRLAGEGQRHHGAAVEGVFEGDDAGTLGVGARDLDRVLDGLGAAVHEDRLLRKLAGRDFVHALGEADVALVRRDLHAGVQEAVELIFHRVDDRFLAMADVEAADAAGEIEVAVAVDVFEPGVFGLGDVDRRAVRKAAGHGFARRSERARDFGPGMGVRS